MLPEEMPKTNVTITLDFDRLYGIINIAEKEMRGFMIESPPWDRRIRPIDTIKQVATGIKMFFKVRSFMLSAEVIPESAKGDMEKLVSIFTQLYKMKMNGDAET